jgi:uncharacterized protein (DUF4415 family)
MDNAKKSNSALKETPCEIQTAVRYDADIIDVFQCGGPGWQTRMNNALCEWLKAH